MQTKEEKIYTKRREEQTQAVGSGSATFSNTGHCGNRSPIFLNFAFYAQGDAFS